MNEGDRWKEEVYKGAGRLIEAVIFEEYLEEAPKGPSSRELPEIDLPLWKQVVGLLVSFALRFARDGVGAYAAAAAYFLIMSFIPFVMFLSTMVRYTDLSYNMLSATIRSLVPANLQSFVMTLVAEVYNSNTAILPISMVLTLWSSGKAVQSLINGMNVIFRVKETRNWLINRIYSVFYTMVFGVTIIGSFVFLAVGSKIYLAIVKVFPSLRSIPRGLGILGFRNLAVFLVVTLFFLFLYMALPNRHTTLRSQLGGALIASLGWTIFSNLLAAYFAIFPSASRMYGSMTALILIMMFVYFFMLFLLGGALLNDCFEEKIAIASAAVWRQIQEKRNERLQRKQEKRKRKLGKLERAKKKKDREGAVLQEDFPKKGDR